MALRDGVFIGSVALIVTGAATMHPALAWVTAGLAGLLLWVALVRRGARTE